MKYCICISRYLGFFQKSPCCFYLLGFQFGGHHQRRQSTTLEAPLLQMSVGDLHTLKQLIKEVDLLLYYRKSN